MSDPRQIELTVSTRDLKPGDESEWSEFTDGEFLIETVERHGCLGVRWTSDPEAVYMWPDGQMWKIRRVIR